MNIRVKGVNETISRVKKYRRETLQKVKRLMEELSILGAYRARVEFTDAFYAGDNDVEVRVSRTKTGYKVVAKGRAVLFIEFGAGVANDKDVHPQQAEFGFSYGTYGKGKGANPNGWFYVGEQGNAGRPIRKDVYHTYGNPPAKAMYYASKDMKEEIYNIAMGVFG